MTPHGISGACKTPSGETLTVYFDGSCPICAAEIGYYSSRRGGSALRLVDVSAEPSDLGDDLDRETAMGRFHVRRADGSLLSGAAAFAALWEMLPGWRVIGRLAQLPPIKGLLEIGYRAFLPLRPYLSRLAGQVGR